MAIAAAFALCAAPAAAAPGDLDPSFDLDGIVTENVGTRAVDARIDAVGQQSDGKTIAAGQTLGTGGVVSQFVIARYNTDGALDTTFGEDGIVILTVGEYSSSAHDLAIQSDDKIVVAGNAFRDFGVIRLNADGSFDGSFGDGGQVTTDFNSNADTANAVEIDGSGKIVVAGEARGPAQFDDDDFAVARYNSDGSLDTSFSGDGLVTADVQTDFQDEILGLELDATGRIVAVGESGGDFALARFLANGTLDGTFDTDGLVTTDFGGLDNAQDVAIAAGGEISAVGQGDGDLAAARYTSAGALDTSFDTDGKVTV